MTYLKSNIAVEALIVGGNDYTIINLSDTRKSSEPQKIQPRLKKTLIPVSERTKIIRKGIAKENISTPTKLFEILKSGKYGYDDGIMFLDTKLNIITFMPFIKNRSMKDTTADIYRVAEKTNASAIIGINNNGTEDQAKYVLELFAKGISSVDVVDVINKGESLNITMGRQYRDTVGMSTYKYNYVYNESLKVSEATIESYGGPSPYLKLAKIPSNLQKEFENAFSGQSVGPRESIEYLVNKRILSGLNPPKNIKALTPDQRWQLFKEESERLGKSPDDMLAWMMKQRIQSATGKSFDNAVGRLKEKFSDERGSVSFDKISGTPVYEDLMVVAKHIYTVGNTRFNDFTNRMRWTFSQAWDKIKGLMLRIWSDVRSRLQSERGSISMDPKKTPPPMQAPKAMTTEQWLADVVKKKGFDRKTIDAERHEFEVTEDEVIKDVVGKRPSLLKFAQFESLDKPDINQADIILGTPLHYSNKVPAYKRLRVRFGEKIDVQNEMIDRMTLDPTDKSGKTYYTKTIAEAKKKDAKGFDVYAKYRNWQDREQYGYRVKVNAETGKFDIYAPGEVKSIKTFLTKAAAEKAGYAVAKKKSINPDLVKTALFGDKWNYYLPKNQKAVSSFITEDAAYEDIIQREIRDFDNKYHPSPAILKALEADKRVMNNGFNVLMQGMRDLIKWYESRGLDVPSSVETIKKSNGEVEEIQVNLRAALVQMGDRRGYYYPRNRNQGKFMLRATQEGLPPYMKFFDLGVAEVKKGREYSGAKALLMAGTPAGKAYRDLIKKGFKHENIVFRKALRPLEDIFLDGVGRVLNRQTEINDALDRIKAGDINLEKLNLSFVDRRLGPGRRDFAVTGPSNKAQNEVFKKFGGRWYSMSSGEPKMWHFQNPGKNFEKRLAKALVTVSEHIDLESMTMFAKALTESISDLEKSRGHRAHMIARSAIRGRDVYRGYEEDPSIAIPTYAAGIAGGEAKKTIAMDAMKIFLGTDISWYQFQAIKQYRGGFDQYIHDFRNARDFQGEFGDFKKAFPETGISSPEMFELLRATEDREITSQDFDSINDPDGFEENLQKIVGLEAKKEEIGADAIFENDEWSKAHAWLYDEYRKVVDERKISDQKQPNAYRDGQSYIRENLRNDETADRVMGFVKGLAVLKYLAGRVSAPIVNLTALPTATPAAINVHANIPMTEAGKYLISGITVYSKFSLNRTDTLSDDDIWALKQIKTKKWDAPKFNREALTALESKLGRSWNNIIEVLMVGFGKSEQLNRGATIIGSYKAIRANKPKMNREEALKLAKEVSDQAHSVYNKSNWPSWIRGPGLMANAAKAFYIFRSFSHNYLQLIKDAHGPGILHTPEHKAAFSWLVLSPALIAGTGAMVGKELVFAMLKAFGIGGDDPEEGLYNFVGNHFGERSEIFARYGAAGMFGVNLKGSLSIGITDIPTNIVDLLGAPGSMLLKDPIDMVTAFKRDNYLKMAEKVPVMPLFLANPIRAIRESTQGVTTWTNTPVFYGNQQLMADKSDIIARAASFNPVSLSMPREIQYNELLVERKYRDWKTDIYSKVKAFYKKSPENRSMENWADIVGEIREFNARVYNRNIKGVPQITDQSLKGVIKSLRIAPKKERLRVIK